MGCIEFGALQLLDGPSKHPKGVLRDEPIPGRLQVERGDFHTAAFERAVHGEHSPEPCAHHSRSGLGKCILKELSQMQG